MAGQVSHQPNVVGTATLDDIDRSLLRLLATDGRMTNKDLAATVGLAPSTCLLRVRRLTEAGVITGVRAELSPAALGRPLQALIAVRLQTHARAQIGAFTQRYAALPGVLNVFFLAGGNDFLLHVAAATPDDLRRFVVENLSASAEVMSTETNLIFEHASAGSTALLDRRAADGAVL